jgi:hypothetical protein
MVQQDQQVLYKMNSIRENYKKYLDYPSRDTKDNYIWSIAEALQKVDHSGRKPKEKWYVRFFNKIKGRLVKEKPYKDTYFAIKMPFDKDDFADLQIVDFSPKALTGDITSALYPSPAKKFVIFAKVVGFSDSNDIEFNWGMNYKDYLKDKFKKK